MHTITALHYETLRAIRIDHEKGIIQKIMELDSQKCGEALPIVAPGLIDNQVNGYAGVDFSGDELTPEALLHATKSLWKTGVTTFLPTLITNSSDNMLRNLRMLASALNLEEVALSVPGFHLEGPWISGLEGFRGCHPNEHVSLPDIELFKRLQEATGGRIVQVTLAPELPGALSLLDYFRQQGVVAAIGHSSANASEIIAACDHGVSLSTHLGNGCANLIHRHENPIWPQLADERLIPTLIADGHHLLPEELKVFLKVKGAERIILTSDLTYLAGMPAGSYQFGGAEVLLTEDGRLRTVLKDYLAGATLPLLTGVEKMVRFTGCSLAEGIRMASANVASVFGWKDRGELLPGRRADLLLLENKKGNLILKETILNGKTVFESNSFDSYF